MLLYLVVKYHRCWQKSNLKILIIFTQQQSTTVAVVLLDAISDIHSLEQCALRLLAVARLLFGNGQVHLLIVELVLVGQVESFGKDRLVLSGGCITDTRST